MDKLKLKWKIFIFLLGFCVLLLAILWIFQTVFLSDMYKFVRKMEMEKAIQTVEKNINNPELGNILLELEASKAITVRPTQEFYPPSLPAPGRHKNGPETITSVREFVLEDGKKISLTFHAMITPVDSTVSTLQIRLVIITGMMVLLATMLAILIAKHISKPIEKINQSAKALAKGNYDTEFRGKGYLEIKELSDTLNTAATELSKTERLRRELIANVSHDLRTPLALIYSYAEMMHDFPDEVTPDQSQIIMDETKRLTSLVNDMPDISLLEAGVYFEMQYSLLHDYTLSMDAEIMKLRQKQAGLLRVTRSAYARNLLIKWFVDFDLPIQYDGMYESEYGQIPNVMDLVPLEDLIDETLGGEWGKEESEGRYTHAIRCIRGTDIPNVQKSYYEDIPVRYVQKKHIDEKGIKANDIIVEISGGSPIQSTGRICFISDEILKDIDSPVLCTNFCRIIRLKKPELAEYVYNYLLLLYSRGYFFNLENNTTGIKNLIFSAFAKNIKVPLPKDLSVIQKYYAALDAYCNEL
jgi:signal transduction histidine kinase